MVALLLYCNSCGCKWEIIERDDFTNEKHSVCPNCGEQIDRQTWDRFILPAFGVMIDANNELTRDAIANRKSGFTAAIRTTVPRDLCAKSMRTKHK